MFWTNSTVMAHCTQLCTTKKNFYLQQIKKFFLGITLFDTFSLLFQKEKNLMSLFLIACNRGLKILKKCFMWTVTVQRKKVSFPRSIIINLRTYLVDRSEVSSILQKCQNSSGAQVDNQCYPYQGLRFPLARGESNPTRASYSYMWSCPVGEWNYCCHFSYQFVIKQRVFVCVRHSTCTPCSLMCTALHAYVVWHINYNNAPTHAPMPCVKQTIQNYNVRYHPLSTTPWQTPRPASQHV